MIRRCLVFVFTWSDCEWNSRLAERARVMARMAMTARMESQTMNPLIHLIRRIQVRERSQAPDRDSVMSQQDSARSLSTAATTFLKEKSPASLVPACSSVIWGAETDILRTRIRRDLPLLKPLLSLQLLPSAESTMKVFIREPASV